jgi:hypothetical protein
MCGWPGSAASSWRTCRDVRRSGPPGWRSSFARSCSVCVRDGPCARDRVSATAFHVRPPWWLQGGRDNRVDPTVPTGSAPRAARATHTINSRRTVSEKVGRLGLRRGAAQRGVDRRSATSCPRRIPGRSGRTSSMKSMSRDARRGRRIEVSFGGESAQRRTMSDPGGRELHRQKHRKDHEPLVLRLPPGISNGAITVRPRDGVCQPSVKLPA